MGSTVSLVKTDGYEKDLENCISRALDLISFNREIQVKSVIIKPNLCYYWDSSTGYTTDPRIVGRIIEVIRKKYGDVDIKIAEADASAMRTRHAFPVLGYTKLAAEKGVELVNLSEDELVETPVTVNGHNLSFKVPQLLLKTDLFVNVPKLKVMKATKITCAMKNVFGCIGYSRKVKYHPVLDEAIVGINKILRPHLTIVDGLVALGRHPIRLDLLMAGVDPFSVDWVASYIIGYNPARVRFLKLAMKEEVGSPDGIMAVGEKMSDFQKSFPKPSSISTKYAWSMMFWLLKAYTKVSGDVVPPVLEE